MKRARLLTGAMLGVGVFIVTALLVPHGLRGSLTGSGTLEERVLSFSDTNGDGLLYAAEARDALNRVIQGVAAGDMNVDVNGDGVLNNDDSAAMADTLKLILSSTCGNATIQASEECDDANTGDGDGCSSMCFIEPGFLCSGVPSACSEPAACGNGIVESGEACDDGNAQTGDGCDAQCTVEAGYGCVGSPSACSAQRGYLSLAVHSSITENTVAKGQANVALLRFYAAANKYQNLTMTSVSFVAKAGSISNATNYTLWVDTNGDKTGDVVVQSGVSPVDGVLTFDMPAGGYAIPADTKYYFTVHGDISPSPLDSTLQLAFAVAVPDYVRGYDPIGELPGISTNSICSLGSGQSCRIYVSTSATAPAFAIVDAGDLYVTLGTQAPSRQLLGGSLSDDVLRLALSAKRMNIDVTTLQLSTWDSLGASVDRIEFYRADDATLIATATTAGCGAETVLTANPANGKAISTFCADMTATPLSIVKDQRVDLLTKVRMKTDENGAVSKESLKFWLPKNAGTVQARDPVSGIALAPNDGDSTGEGEVFIGVSQPAVSTDIVGNTNVSVLAKIISVVNANPDADDTAVPTGAYPIGRLTFTAAVNDNALNGLNRAYITTILFFVYADNVSIDASGFKIYDARDASSKRDCWAVNQGGTTLNGAVTGTMYATCSLPTDIASGDSVTFVLEANVLNPAITPASGSELQASMNRLNTPVTGCYYWGSPVCWYDKDAGSNVLFYWFDVPYSEVYSTLYTLP